MFLDSLRALAALYVLIHHALTVTKERGFFDGVPPLVGHMAEFFSAGHLAVDLFIVLSGFSLMLAVLRKEQVPHFWPFLGRRAQRILPPYYAAVLLPLAVHVMTGGYLLPEGDLALWPIVAHVLLIHDLFSDTWGNVNNVLWSVSVEWRIYLLFPFFGYLYLKRGLRVMLAASVLVSVLAVAFCVGLHLPQVFNWTGICPQYVVLFALGMACCAVRFSDKSKYVAIRRKLERLPWKWFWLGLAPALVMLVVKGGILWKLFGDAAIFGFDFIVGIFAALLLLYASFTATPDSRNLLGSKPLAKVGLMAYSIYLFHYPVLQLIANIARDYVASNPLRLLLVYTVGIPLAYGGACVFYRFIERPFAVRKKAPRTVVGTKTS